MKSSYLKQPFFFFLLLTETLFNCTTSSIQPQENRAPDNEADFETISSLDSKPSPRHLAQANPSAFQNPYSFETTLGKAYETAQTLDDPEFGFAQGPWIQLFKKALFFYHAENYREALILFSQLVDLYPDEPLAGSAQFYRAQCYFLVQEWRSAHQAFQEFLSSYTRNPHLPDVLKQLAYLENILGHSENARRYQTLLFSVFPQSPAVQNFSWPTSPELAPLESKQESASP